MLQQSDADIKVVVASPEIISNEEFRREFSKVAIAQRRQGRVFYAEMLDGERIMRDQVYVDTGLKTVFTHLVEQVTPLKKKPPRPELKFPQPQHFDILPDEKSDKLFSNLFPVISIPDLQTKFERRHVMKFLNSALYTHLKSYSSLQQHPSFKSTYFYKPDSNEPKVVNGRTVASSICLPSGELCWIHDSVTLRFVMLGEIIFLLVEPGYAFTKDGEKLLCKEKAGPLTTKRLAHEFNRQYLEHIIFWISTLAAGNDSITIPTDWGPIVISVKPVEISANFGGGIK